MGHISCSPTSCRSDVPTRLARPSRGARRRTHGPDVSSLPDVIVVGGGPAGATAALTAARAGARVQLLERAVFPRNKPCGGAISMRALSRFPWLEPALGRVPTHRVSRMYLESPSGDGITLTSHAPAALMIR